MIGRSGGVRDDETGAETAEAEGAAAGATGLESARGSAAGPQDAAPMIERAPTKATANK